MIRFSCPACMKPLKAPLNATGQKVACPRCGGRVFVPPSVGGKTAPSPSNPSPNPSPRPDAWGRGGKLLTFLAAALVVLGFAAAGTWLGREDPSPPKEGGGSQTSRHRPSSVLDLPWPTREDPKEETRVVPTEEELQDLRNLTPENIRKQMPNDGGKNPPANPPPNQGRREQDGPPSTLPPRRSERGTSNPAAGNTGLTRLPVPPPVQPAPPPAKAPSPAADAVPKKRPQADEKELLARLLDVPELRLFKDEEVQEFRKQSDSARLPARNVLVAKLHQDMVVAGVREGLPFRPASKARLDPAAAAVMDKLSTELRDMGFVSGSPSPGAARRSRTAAANKPLEKLEAFQQWCDQSQIARFSGALPTLLQMLQVEDTPLRLLLVRELAKVKNKDTTAALALRALFDLAPEVREEAIKSLEKRHSGHYVPVLVQGLRYPWPPVADHAAHALRKLKPEDAVPKLVDLLDLPDPSAPVEKRGKPVVRELVRLDHMRNCLLCHAPALTKDVGSGPEGSPNGPVPVPGVPLPPGYYKAQGTVFARADVTFLRQDFSVPLANQRFDFVVRTRTPRPDETAKAETRSGGYPQRESVLYALRGITGKDGGKSSTRWRDLLDIAEVEKRP